LPSSSMERDTDDDVDVEGNIDDWKRIRLLCIIKMKRSWNTKGYTRVCKDCSRNSLLDLFHSY
jgi:hypothetical protein